ncbi:hypothetical protein GNF10_22340 [Nostoc sp. UCD121]|uniref:hypothetical protein n=1 Tax=unclassified Nostoc TaxID=2593658 RepID=UPI001623DECC|nr:MULTISPECIES: hypothetical protein [unclassified Nostoc]MBC1225065.1 hypothetical protein [Nostoc sp. UCD120]MBC1278629.1 hypothetical protein [Nostoc sp. UCD121]MBC1299797.1 hypothetical protein [Nostoc sp. UCD122]
MRKRLVHLKYSGQDFVHQIERCICFDAQQSNVYDGLRLRFTENLKNKAIGSCGRVSAITCCGKICDRTCKSQKVIADSMIAL